jgi:hypothetical protein
MYLSPRNIPFCVSLTRVFLAAGDGLITRSTRDVTPEYQYAEAQLGTFVVLIIS